MTRWRVTAIGGNRSKLAPLVQAVRFILCALCLGPVRTEAFAMDAPCSFCLTHDRHWQGLPDLSGNALSLAIDSCPSSGCVFHGSRPRLACSRASGGAA